MFPMRRGGHRFRLSLHHFFGAVAKSTLANATMLDTVGLTATRSLTDARSASRSLTTSRTCYEQYQRYRRYLQHCSFRTVDTVCYDVMPFQYVGVASVPAEFALSARLSAALNRRPSVPSGGEDRRQMRSRCQFILRLWPTDRRSKQWDA